MLFHAAKLNLNLLAKANRVFASGLRLANEPAESGTQRPSVICLRAPNWPARLASPGGRKVFFGEGAKRRQECDWEYIWQLSPS